MLPKFAKQVSIPSGIGLMQVLRSSVDRIMHFALGPAGTNISQAAMQWSNRMGVSHKTEVVFCDTPEDSVARAREIIEPGVLPIFWTCAVYFRLNELFFRNTDTFLFQFIEVMNLDEMQLAENREAVRRKNAFADQWEDTILTIASHPSPAALMSDSCIRSNFYVRANSNAHAAKICAEGEVEQCITTESARQIYGLVKIHTFGSPAMVFFGGTTLHGIQVLQSPR